MLQRAASNAYSWWWASHIRTKQSKWMEQNLQDMEEKVQNALKLIEEDGDSFAKRAEMYYKKRPELISFVEEAYRAYRALAERYDHISTELQNANTTIASVFPEQVQFSIDEEDDMVSPKNFSEAPKSNIPKAPSPLKNLSMLTRNKQNRKTIPRAAMAESKNSGLEKSEALKEIDVLQRTILALQTEKEFVRISYEGGVNKYMEIEKRMEEMQEQVYSLQDECNGGTVIEDDEARTLMTTSALKSCEQALNQLQKQQEICDEKTRIEEERIVNSRRRLKSIKSNFSINPENREEERKVTVMESSLPIECEKLSEMEMAEKVDELAMKVVALETSVISASALVERLRCANDEMENQLRVLDEQRSTTMQESEIWRDKLRELDEKLQILHDLDRNLKELSSNVQQHSTESRSILDRILYKLQAEKTTSEDYTPRENQPHFEERNLKQSEEQERYLQHGENLHLQNHSEREFQQSREEERYLQHRSTNLKNSVNEDDTANLNRQNHINERKFQQSGEQDRYPADRSIDLEAEMTSHDDTPVANLNQQNHFKEQEFQKTEEQERHQPHRSIDFQREKTEDDSPVENLNQHNHLDKRHSQQPEDQERSLRHGLMESKAENEQKEAESGEEEEEKVLENSATVPNDESKDKLLEELRNANSRKDEVIQSLLRRLKSLQSDSSRNKVTRKHPDSKDPPVTTSETLDKDNLELILLDHSTPSSALEEKFRTDIDELLEQNLDFWMRFSTFFQEIQKYQTSAHDLQSEISILKNKQENGEPSHSASDSLLKSEIRPIYKHLREIQTELGVWIEQSVSLKDELQSRFSSLCSIKEDVTKALKSSSESFSSYQAAKFQGEISNMQQENNKVADELQAGLDHVTGLQIEIEKTLVKLNEEYKLSGSRNHQSSQLRHASSGTRVPLRAFIFASKAKKSKPSFFACMHPVMHRRQNMKSALSTSKRE